MCTPPLPFLPATLCTHFPDTSLFLSTSWELFPLDKRTSLHSFLPLWSTQICWTIMSKFLRHHGLEHLDHQLLSLWIPHSTEQELPSDTVYAFAQFPWQILGFMKAGTTFCFHRLLSSWLPAPSGEATNGDHTDALPITLLFWRVVSWSTVIWCVLTARNMKELRAGRRRKGQGSSCP